MPGGLFVSRKAQDEYLLAVKPDGPRVRGTHAEILAFYNSPTTQEDSDRFARWLSALPIERPRTHHILKG